MKVVFDTDVIIAGMRSPTGASAELLRLARHGTLALQLSVPLFLEYEAKCTMSKHYQAAGLTLDEVYLFLDSIVTFSQAIQTHYLWRPQLRDPADEMVLETAVNGGVEALVSFNHKDFKNAPAHFGIALLLPAELLRRIQ
ncbi:MAG: putative toxin-antitoxin system toxin component, PIN family [Gammaproteobacteria bacterium]|nr:MAG: putative toxin-antitoxin system toxin component, PIN family [Gammaproteobacteria bacterium]